ncbi:hypothetical protein [Blastococcus sp. SYSU DS0539]
MGTGRSAVVIGALASALAACAPAGARQEEPRDSGPFVEFSVPGEPVPLPHPEELLALPPVPWEVHALLEEVQTRWGEHPDLGQSEISRDRELVILRWHGPPPAELVALTDSAAGFDVRIDATPFRTTELVAEAGRLVREHPGVVTGAGPRGAGDGITVGIDPSAAGSADADALEDLGVISRFPLFPQAMSAPVAASAVG